MSQPWELGVDDLGHAYRAGDTSPTEVVTSLLERCDRIDPELGAFSAILTDSALDDARRCTEQFRTTGSIGPLHGVPVAVKELIDVANAPVTFGSQVFADRVATSDAEVVTSLRRAGAIIFGLTRSHEFGWGITTRRTDGTGTVNPWAPSRIAGGSSGGSAAAVAARMVPLALGTDTGGSLRIPSAFCGVLGVKPSHGLIGTKGVVPLAPSLDHVGGIARGAADLDILLGVLSGVPRDGADDRGDQLARTRVGLLADLEVPPLVGEYRELFDDAVRAVAETGATVVELTLEHGADAMSAFTAIQQAEAYHVHHTTLGTYPSRHADYGDDVRGRLEAAEHVDLERYLRGREMRAVLRAEFREAFARVDVLLTPAAACPPSRISTPDVSDYDSHQLPLRDLVLGHTSWQDLTGLPACNVPWDFDSLGLPFSVQLTGAARTESHLLGLAGELHRLGRHPVTLQPNV